MGSQSSPINLGRYEYTKMEASSICASKGKKLCKQKDLIKSDFCSCGWADDVLTPGYPMANGDKTGKGWCGGDNEGKVWRDCGAKDWLNPDGTIFNTNKKRADGQRHASAFCCDSTGVNTGEANISNMLENIQNLQATEQALINQLDAYTSSKGYVSSDPKIIEMVNNINNIANSRISLFQSISANADVIQTGVSQSRVDLVAQMTLLQVVEDQLNHAKLKIQELQATNDTKMRMVQINTYYGQRYEAQSSLMKKIIFICIPILVVFILKKKSIIPETISNYIIGIVTAIGGFIIMYNVWDIHTRSNMDFNTYEWKYQSPDAHIPSIWQYNKENMFNFDKLLTNLMKELGLCVGETCCSPGLVYDPKNQLCVQPMKSYGNTTNSQAAIAAKQGFENRVGSTTQGFATGREGLKGAVVGTYYNDDKNSFNGIEPFSYDMAYLNL